MSTKTHGRMVTDGSISSGNIADDAITTVKVLDANITGAKIADNSITGAKIALGGDTTGDIMYYDGTNWVRSATNLSFPGGKAPYDISFLAGWDAETVKSNVAVQTYGEMVMGRTGTFQGEAGYIDTVCTGQNLICDVMKNGTTIYASTKPQFAASATAITAGVLTTTAFVSGDRITFKVTQIGSSAVGQGVRFMLKCKA